MKAKELPQVGVADVAKKLGEVGNRRMTLQTMIFEPGPLRLHLALGECPTSDLPLRAVDLEAMFKAGLVEWMSCTTYQAASGGGGR